ncbi:tRNA uracil 4-sulfurtransferase ThiI [Sphaerochaeta sp. PS]|uniref:tRNA uracil 4-sulfurtransferase ThiI n=1 Tax=Sphaerochaeta sp. PS TaxID=3076336 RepID=UPI0028A3641D|nr:tRNA uracil 4-sulfurtransferase ThiI [Sphaerochaeta sp. PS]MDT4761409.1 tRNA uracil 4-sulfurtransferase ThiI [Sphaerochaeta sp. PS]
MKDSTLYLVRLGEISLKGLNRDFFEKRLKQNIKNKLKPYRSLVTKQKGRLYFEVSNECPEEQALMAFRTTFGVVGFSKCLRCEKDIEAIKKVAAILIKEPPFASGEGTFKSETKRADKLFPMNSYEIDCELGGVVLDAYPSMKVNAKYPDKVIFCEIRDMAYLYTSPQPGPGGLPVTTAGKGMLLLSGGIDSPVAAYMMGQRGLKQECIYFHAYPYTSELAQEKVEKLASLIAPYLQGTRLHVVPFTEPQLWIREHSPEDEHTLMFRAAMMKVANAISLKQEGMAIVTGEALSQVASQTLESMAFTDSMSDQLVLRPLVGMDKLEIITLAKAIGTYETSILPYEDCCVIFSPKHPLVRPNKKSVTEHFVSMGIEPLLEKAIEETQTLDFGPDGNRRE